MAASLPDHARETDALWGTFQMSIRQTGTWVIMMTMTAATIWLTASAVSAHSLGYSSVDDCEIRWQDYTKYDTERVTAQNAWEDLKGSDNCVDLAPDTWYTVADLKWMDVDEPNAAWIGRWGYRPGIAHADLIHFNIPKMDVANSCKRKGVAIHELGHAHGLDEAYFFDSVMNPWVSDICELRDHDISDYEELWGPQ